MLSSTDAWIVGSLSSTRFGLVQAALMLYWDGTSWQRVSGAKLLGSRNGLIAITHALGSSRVWSTGYNILATSEAQSALMVSSSDEC